MFSPTYLLRFRLLQVISMIEEASVPKDARLGAIWSLCRAGNVGGTRVISGSVKDLGSKPPVTPCSLIPATASITMGSDSFSFPLSLALLPTLSLLHSGTSDSLFPWTALGTSTGGGGGGGGRGGGSCALFWSSFCSGAEAGTCIEALAPLLMFSESGTSISRLRA